MTRIHVFKNGIDDIDVVVDEYELTQYTESFDLQYDNNNIHYSISIPRKKGFNICISEVEVID